MDSRAVHEQPEKLSILIEPRSRYVAGFNHVESLLRAGLHAHGRRFEKQSDRQTDCQLQRRC
jgi:hypothetical protein